MRSCSQIWIGCQESSLSLLALPPSLFWKNSVAWINLCEWKGKLHCLVEGSPEARKPAAAGPPPFQKWPWGLLGNGRCSAVPPRQVPWHLRDVFSRGEECTAIAVNPDGLWVHSSVSPPGLGGHLPVRSWCFLQGSGQGLLARGSSYAGLSWHCGGCLQALESLTFLFRLDQAGVVWAVWFLIPWPANR